MRPSKTSRGELQFVDFARPSLVDAPPEGEGWIHEVKFNGYRTQLVIDRGRIRLFTKNAHDWTEKYWPIALAAEALPCWSAIIDGEVIVSGENGISDFDALGQAIRAEPRRLLFVAFDLLHLDGRDLRATPLIERKEALRELVDGGKRIQYSEHFETEGSQFFQACNGMGLEGIVSKKGASRYRSGPTRDWLNVRCFVEDEFDVLGVVRKPGEAPLALMADRDRNYVGSAFVQLDRATRERFWKRVEEMKAKKPPVGLKKPDAQWIRPGIIGRVKYLRGDGGLRHASLKDVREIGSN